GLQRCSYYTDEHPPSATGLAGLVVVLVKYVNYAIQAAGVASDRVSAATSASHFRAVIFDRRRASSVSVGTRRPRRWRSGSTRMSRAGLRSTPGPGVVAGAGSGSAGKPPGVSRASPGEVRRAIRRPPVRHDRRHTRHTWSPSRDEPGPGETRVSEA